MVKCGKWACYTRTLAWADVGGFFWKKVLRTKNTCCTSPSASIYQKHWPLLLVVVSIYPTATLTLMVAISGIYMYLLVSIWNTYLHAKLASSWHLLYLSIRIYSYLQVLLTSINVASRYSGLSEQIILVWYRWDDSTTWHSRYLPSAFL